MNLLVVSDDALLVLVSFVAQVTVEGLLGVNFGVFLQGGEIDELALATLEKRNIFTHPGKYVHYFLKNKIDSRILTTRLTSVTVEN
jgi:hypothetical protein